MSMEIVCGKPLTGKNLEMNIRFLDSLGLRYEENVESSILFLENGEISASGSREGNVLKCIGVSPKLQGSGLAVKLISLLAGDAAESGFAQLFIYTKPENMRFFTQLGFYEVAETEGACIMDSRRNGVEKFLSGVPRFESGETGCAVVNCDPMTKGHLYLIEKAADLCDNLYVFVLSARKGLFPAQVRFEMVRSSAEHLKNVRVEQGGDYIVSPASFPDYFIKDRRKAEDINCSLDLELFAERIAAPLGITKRFVGSEPLCPVTAKYNRQMKQRLGQSGIEVVEIERLCQNGGPISAGRVRRLLEQGKTAQAEALVPEKIRRCLREVCFGV